MTRTAPPLMEYSERMDRSDRKKRAIWQWIDEHHPEWWDEPNHPAFSSRARLLQLGVVADRAVGAKGRTRTETRVLRRWLAEASYRSPFVDHVAVQRAMDFDWDVIANLTEKEYTILVTKLAAMEDPFSQQDEQRGEGHVLVRASRRRLAYLDAPVGVSMRLLTTVRSRQTRAREAAAA